MEPKNCKSESVIRYYFALSNLPSLTLLHSTPQDASDCPESLVIADFMVLDRHTEKGLERLCIAF
jgi:hypothetical protein